MAPISINSQILLYNSQLLIVFMCEYSLYLFISHQELISWSLSLLHKISCYGSNEHRKILTDAKIIPPLIVLLRSSNADVVRNTVKTLGNISLDNTEQRNLIISEGAVQTIIYYVKRSAPV